jgi:uncharacterized protein (DUF983 family)
VERPRIRQVLLRGLKRRCPHCGVGSIYKSGIRFNERCPACGFKLQRDRGDTLMFMFLTDRIPLLFGIAAVYLGFSNLSLGKAIIFLLALVIPMVATIRERQGLALALDYLSRTFVADPSDELHRQTAQR